MAALNFPTSPSTNEIYTANGKSWRWDGTSWRTYFTLGVDSGGTGLTGISGTNSFLASNSSGTGLSYRSFLAGSGITIAHSINAVTFTATGSGTLTGSGTSTYIPLFTSGGTAVTDSIMSQVSDIIIVSGSIKALTKSFKIPHPLDPQNKYLEHGSLEGPEHGIYQRGRGSGYGLVEVELPNYFHALSENDISVMITPRINAGLYVSESNSFSFKVKRIKGSFLRKEYIEFDYFVIGERKDIKLQVEQDK
jgi:hypothetical protein